MGAEEWDIFTSHASEDKVEVARPLANILSTKGMKVWLDESELFVGDRLRAKIDEGLAHSQFGIVILSPSFFSKHWPQAELDVEIVLVDAIDLSDLLQHSVCSLGPRNPWFPRRNRSCTSDVSSVGDQNYAHDSEA
jgi:hypothetical protein